MKKILKSILIFLIVLLLLTAGYLAARIFLFPREEFSPENEIAEVEPGIVEIAEESEKIDFNEETGVLYVNNEVIVFIRSSAAQEKITALLEQFDATVDDSMADIYIYRLLFREAMTYEELDSVIKKLKSDSIVENAYINPVTPIEADAHEEGDDFEYKSAAYPNDPWNNDSWDVNVPRGENWGMEAINAPGAWGYLDRLSAVRIGLIDTVPRTDHPDLRDDFGASNLLFIDENTGLTHINRYSITPDDHGTHVSGTMNGTWNNGTGVTGVMAGKGELYYSAVLYDSNGSVSERYGTAYSYLLALKNLIDQDVQVVNISQNTWRLLGFAASHGNQNAINYLSLQADLTEKGLSRIIAARKAANKPDFVICVAAGNSNSIYYFKDDEAPYGYREEMNLWEAIKWEFGWRGEIGNSLALYNNFLNLMDLEEVKNRVICVGAVGINTNASTATRTQYSYAYFSNVGSRVDVVAPGVDVYSCTVSGYDSYDGTSMATPHVSGVAGLIFAANPSLSGPQVKQILCASTTGRYYHGGPYSGLLNAEASVVNALKTVDTTVEKVLKTEVESGLDLCFVVDTTGSMGDDIDNAKENMADILEHLAEKTENYRVALIDYRDYPSRTDNDEDYPYKVQLEFTNNNANIIDAIEDLDLGDGGDGDETVYSALMAAVGLKWRSDAKKVIIILGDAAPLDPEPISDYTYDEVLLALFNADINIDYEDSDDRVVDALDTALINVFSIGTGASADAADFFEDISLSTGGSYAGVDDASEVGDAIIESIEQIEVIEKYTVDADFGDAMANQQINIYSGKDYLFTVQTDENGRVAIDAMEADTYKWTSNSLYGGGSLDIEAGGKAATVRMTHTYWFAPALELWQQYRLVICATVVAYLALCVGVPAGVKRLCNWIRGKKSRAAAKASAAETAAAPAAEPPAQTGQVCPDCGFAVEAGARFCRKCGCDLQAAPAAPRVCPNCGRPCTDQETFCGECGTKIDG